MQKQIGRRGFFAMAMVGALSNCGGGGLTPAPAVISPPVPVPVIASTPGKVAAVIKAIADGVGGVLPAIGLAGGRVETATALVGELAGIAGQLAASGGGALAGWLDKARNVVSLLSPFLPSGKLPAAIASALSHALALAGIGSPHHAAAVMPVDDAMAILRTAANGQLS